MHVVAIRDGHVLKVVIPPHQTLYVPPSGPRTRNESRDDVGLSGGRWDGIDHQVELVAVQHPAFNGLGDLGRQAYLGQQPDDGPLLQHSGELRKVDLVVQQAGRPEVDARRQVGAEEVLYGGDGEASVGQVVHLHSNRPGSVAVALYAVVSERHVGWIPHVFHKCVVVVVEHPEEEAVVFGLDQLGHRVKLSHGRRLHFPRRCPAFTRAVREYPD
mmetsp:Transcript_46979/g.117134  ORF Transcript_46979/g.117134 Transcript_46979/m.117134 type:complete len:215 (+) Transcript_46979:824-1468(+)